MPLPSLPVRFVPSWSPSSAHFFSFPLGRLSKTLAGAEGFEPPSSVLETDSLTVELTPLFQKLFHFLVRRVLPASRTKLLELQPLRRRFAVLGRRIIPLFTIRALQLTNFAWHLKNSLLCGLVGLALFCVPGH